jgi:hypothetical protein
MNTLCLLSCQRFSSGNTLEDYNPKSKCQHAVIPFDLDNQKRCEPFILYISQAYTAIIYNHLFV